MERSYQMSRHNCLRLRGLCVKGGLTKRPMHDLDLALILTTVSKVLYEHKGDFACIMWAGQQSVGFLPEML